MKRVWLLLLVWVLSVQTSWAAVHFCDESARAGQAGSSHQHADLFPVHDDHTGAGGDAAADACCSVAHAYHGLQALMTQALPQLPLLALPATRAEAPPRGASERYPERHERPQWPAA